MVKWPPFLEPDGYQPRKIITGFPELISATNSFSVRALYVTEYEVEPDAKSAALFVSAEVAGSFITEPLTWETIWLCVRDEVPPVLAAIKADAAQHHWSCS